MARPKKGHEKDATEFVAVRVPPWVKQGLKKLAKKHRGPYSDEALAAFIQYLADHGIEPSEAQNG